MMATKGIFFIKPANFFFQWALVLMLSLVLIESFAGEHKIDSLKSLLGKSPGPNRVRILYDLAYNYTDFDNKVAMTYINQAARLSSLMGDSLMMVKSGRLKSLLYRRLDEMDSSLMLSEKTLPIAERNNYHEETKKILNGMAIVYSYEAMYDKALAIYFRILDASAPEKNKKEYSVALNNVGLVYFKLDDLDQALQYFTRALALNEEIHDERELQTVLINISLCYVYQFNYSAAKEFTDRVLASCKDDCTADILSKCHFNYGLIAYGLKDLQLAEMYYLKSYELAKQTNNELYEMDNLIRLLHIYTETKNVSATKKFTKDAEAILRTDTYYNQGIMELYGELANAYKLFGNTEQVLHYQSKYIELRDQVYNEDLMKNLMKVEAEFLERENKDKIEAQAKILELSDEVITRQRALNIVIGIVAVLSFAIAVVLTQNVKQKRLANLLLEQKVKERTTELETHHLNLLKSLDERNQQVKRITSEIKSSMATIKGLCQLSLQDGSVSNRGQYITKIERASDTLQSGIYRTLGVNEASA